ncbi:MAG: hypothetical protein WA161_07405, partial [Pseudomonas sp.]|uniref:hypothetical protein n=1 Tax=Pseudomonas sp. TaxID=306 RepID=UPI003BB4C475
MTFISEAIQSLNALYSAYSGETAQPFGCAGYSLRRVFAAPGVRYAGQSGMAGELIGRRQGQCPFGLDKG